MPKRVIRGRVIKKSGDQTVSLLVERQITHPRYKKIITKSKKYLIHDADNQLQIDDFATAIECANISKRKSFRLLKIVSSAKISSDSKVKGETQ